MLLKQWSLRFAKGEHYFENPLLSKKYIKEAVQGCVPLQSNFYYIIQAQKGSNLPFCHCLPNWLFRREGEYFFYLNWMEILN